MSEATQYRYPGIQPFTEQQKDLFFGRDDDRERLLSLILLEKLTVLFGKSGYGKSSLLNAGIAPDLEKENLRGKRSYVPVFIRFHAWTGKEQPDWFDRFGFHLARQVPLEDPAEYEHRHFLPQTLWGELKKRQTGQNQVFVLIFDQFEEIFTYPQEQQEAFKQQLADLLYADIPEYLEQNEEAHTPEEVEFMAQKLDVKAVLSVRADRLSELDRLRDKLPAILNKRYELRALSREQAREALEKPAGLPGGEFKSTAFAWQPDAVQKVLQELSRDKQGREIGVEAFQLQILAQNIENQVIQNAVADRDGDGRPDVAVADLPGMDSLYEDFYENALKKLPAPERNKTRHLIEYGLIFEQDNQRINLHEKLIHRDFGVDAALIQRLVDLRLVRAEPSTSGGQNIELSHDSFVFPILNAAKRRKSELWKKRTWAITVFAIAGAVFSLGYILFTRLDTRQSDVVAQQNEILHQQLDSIKVIRNLEEEARNTVLRYLNCVNNKDLECIDSMSADTMERYYMVENLAKAQRKKLEQQYFKRHAAEEISQIKDVMVEKKDSLFEVTANTVYRYEKKGLTPVIFRIRLNGALKVFYLRAYIATE